MESERDTNESNGTKSLNTITSETTVESNQNGHGGNANDKDDSTLTSSANGNQSESTSCDKSESEVASSSNSLHENTENVKIKEEPCDRTDVLGLTKKIFSSFPIKLESEREESTDDSMKNETQKELLDAHETNVCMYLSDEKQLFHANMAKNENNDTNNHPDTKSVLIANGVEYEIRPVEDEQTSKLVFEYLKLVNEEPKGIFSIDISGSLLKNEEDSVNGINTSSSKEGEITVKEEPMDTEDVKSNNDEDEDDTRKRKQPPRRVKVISPVVNEPRNKDQEPNTTKQKALKKLYNNIIPMAPVNKEKDSQVYLHSRFAKSARWMRKKGKLIVDTKVDIPIWEMKMNMQVTSDTLCLSPVQIPMKKRQMQTFEKDNIMTSPGRKIYSEKLSKIYNSRLFSTAAVDSDDELEDLGLPDIAPEMKIKKSKTGTKNVSDTRSPAEDQEPSRYEKPSSEHERYEITSSVHESERTNIEYEGTNSEYEGIKLEFDKIITQLDEVDSENELTNTNLQHEISHQQEFLQTSPINTAEIKTEKGDFFCIDSMVETIKRSLGSVQKSKDNLYDNTKCDIDLLVETINRNESKPVAENCKNENLFACGNDDIEMLVETINRNQSKPVAENRNQSKLVSLSSKKENLFVKSDLTDECEDFNIDSIVNIVNRKINDSTENLDDIETLVETFNRKPETIKLSSEICSTAKSTQSSVGLKEADQTSDQNFHTESSHYSQKGGDVPTSSDEDQQDEDTEDYEMSTSDVLMSTSSVLFERNTAEHSETRKQKHVTNQKDDNNKRKTCEGLKETNIRERNISSYCKRYKAMEFLDKTAEDVQENSVPKNMIGPKSKVKKSKESVAVDKSNRSVLNNAGKIPSKSKFIFDPVTKTLKLNSKSINVPLKKIVPNDDNKSCDKTGKEPGNSQKHQGKSPTSTPNKSTETESRDTRRTAELKKRKAEDDSIDNKTHKKTRNNSDQDKSQRTDLAEANKGKQFKSNHSKSVEKKKVDSSASKMNYQYKCKKSGMSFNTLQNIGSHSKTHKNSTSTSRFRCRICQKTFDRHQHFEKHKKTHKRKFDRTNLRSASSTDGKKQDVSKSKQNNYDRKESLAPSTRSKTKKKDSVETKQNSSKNERETRHRSDTKKKDSVETKQDNSKNERKTRQSSTIVTSLTKTEQMLKCKVCGKMQSSRSNLEKHTTDSHKELIKDKKKLLDRESVPKEEKKTRNTKEEERKMKNQKEKEKPTGEKKNKGQEILKNDRKFAKSIYKCLACKKRFDKSCLLASHVRIHHIIKCQVCNKSVGSVRELVDHMKVHDNVRCHFYDKYLKSTKDLKHHVKMHTKVKNQKVEDKSETVRKELKPKKFSCSKCSKEYTSRIEFDDHMKAHSEILHSDQFAGKSIFPCHKCSGLFTKKEDLLKHIKVHDENTIKCDICFKIYQSQIDLNEHMKIHDTESLKCTVCYLSFPSTAELHKHAKTHKGGKRHKCDICFNSFGTVEELEDHSEKMHNIFSKKCTKCNKIFLSSSDFEVHVQTNCKDEEIACVVCKRQFDTKWELERHVKSHVKNGEIKCILCYKIFNSVKELTLHNNSHLFNECTICFKKFISKDILNKHMKVHYGKNCKQCGVCGECFPSDRKYEDHEKNAHPHDKVKCDTCQSTFQSLAELSDHMATHQPKIFDCTDCKRSFNSKKHLSSHWKQEHNKGMNFMCGLCKIPFKAEKDLTTHVKDCHDNVEYKCGICEKTFPSKKKLTDHIQSHEVEFQCGVCQKEFSTEIQLIEHLQVHAAPADAIACNECSEQFKTQDDLDQHMSSSHTMEEFQCGYCQWFYFSNEALVQHVVTHMASPVYTCDICSEVYESKSEFDKHQHSTGEKRKFMCGSCSFVGKNKNNLMDHLKSHL